MMSTQWVYTASTPGCHVDIQELAGPPGSAEDWDHLLRASLKVGGARDASYHRAAAQVEQFTHGVDAVFRDNGLDVLLVSFGIGPGDSFPAVAARKQYPLVSPSMWTADSGRKAHVRVWCRSAFWRRESQSLSSSWVSMGTMLPCCVACESG